ncbi:MAG: DUF6130 family protein [Verrucomicrobiota bacterium]
MNQGLMVEIIVETVVVAGVKRRHEVVADSPHRLLEGIRTSKYIEWITTATKQTIMFLLVGSIAVSAIGQTAREVLGAAALVPLQNEPPAKIIIDPPLVEALSFGLLVIQYRAENLHILPIFGPHALAVLPRVGHIQITVDDAVCHWADASGNPIIINGLAPWRHKILIQLMNANHQEIDQGKVEVTIPQAHG